MSDCRGAAGVRGARLSGARTIGRFLLLATVLAGCGGAGDGGADPISPPPPTTGTLLVSTATSGAELDANGYTIALDGGQPQSIEDAASLAIAALPEGMHSVLLGGLAGNCAVSGTNPQSVTVAAGDTVKAVFTVACGAGRILFSSDRQGVDGNANIEIDAVSPDGTGQVQISRTLGGANVAPQWSPDGSKIVFITNRDGYNQQVYVMNADGGGAHVLAPDIGYAYQPAWSPDGSEIAAEYGYIKTDGRGIYLMDASDGSNVRQLPAPAGHDYMEGPIWSPDGKSIAYMDQTPKFSGIYVEDVSDGGNRRQITADESDFPLDWSPDGKSILFFRAPDGSSSPEHFQIFTVDADGRNIRQLTAEAGGDTYPGAAWSPSGRRIVYCIGGVVRIMNSDGSQKLALVEGAGLPSNVCGVDWGP